MVDMEKLRLTEMFLNEARLNRALLDEIERLKVENRKLKEKVKLIGKDNLTGVYNRDITEEAYFKADSIVMCDIDNFKNINDTYGHNFGDLILKEVAQILLENVRSTDYVIRWGGEEFLLFIENNDVNVAINLAERIRVKLEGLEGMVFENGVTCPSITMSFGVAQLNENKSIAENIELADTALYESKRNGKNMVTVSTGELVNVSDIGRTR